MLIVGKTGDQVKESGIYKNNYGKKVTLNFGDDFPPCPKCRLSSKIDHFLQINLTI